MRVRTGVLALVVVAAAGIAGSGAVAARGLADELSASDAGPVYDADDGCAQLMEAARRRGPSRLETQGLAASHAPAALSERFEPATLTCLSRQDASGSAVRGLFVEYRDRGAFVAAFVSPSRHLATDWEQYFAEILPHRQLAVHAAGEGLLVVDRQGPAATIDTGVARRPLWSDALIAVHGRDDR